MPITALKLYLMGASVATTYVVSMAYLHNKDVHKAMADATYGLTWPVKLYEVYCKSQNL